MCVREREMERETGKQTDRGIERGERETGKQKDRGIERGWGGK